MAQNLHVCEYKSAPHLCLFEGRSEQSWGQGRQLILDSSYQVVRAIDTVESPSDMHEFNLIDNGRSLLTTAYTVEPIDLSSYGWSEGITYMLNGLFREVDVESGEIKFEWSALDHLEPVHSEHVLKRDHLYRSEPIDFIHLNSVDKYADGDYLVSARHTNCIYKISSQTGAIVWRLGGPQSDFEMDFVMARQHHARIMHQSAAGNQTTISIFNNGEETYYKNTSSAMIVKLDETTMTATMVSRFVSEDPCFVPSQGSVVISPSSGNALVGWGWQGTITEHAPDGRIVWNATIGNMTNILHVASYRAYKSQWHATPRDKPRTWTYAKTAESNTVVHVSWNGATEVARWRVHGYDEDAPPDRFEAIGEADKAGFETACLTSRHVQFAFAEALAFDGTSLANSSVQRTFVPSAELAPFCSETACPMEAGFVNRTSDEQLAKDKRARAKVQSKKLYWKNMEAFWWNACAWVFSLIGVAAICEKAFKRWWYGRTPAPDRVGYEILPTGLK